jgi:hypothetical protein
LIADSQEEVKEEKKEQVKLTPMTHSALPSLGALPSFGESKGKMQGF